ncbi:GntR family transcriptional regulator [Oricola indica]|jgi:DNA-binding GntR family transcriptional regulator|uniref:GntR family transcriptional regulator n=1 Tax=Oricola indica TaxID=2872591 RepID=UPI001CC1574D|nr:FCD domain-containing protein [Oricola indica]
MNSDRNGTADFGERPLVDLLLERLEHLILEGDLKAGDRLKEKSLAAQWDVSRGPIREACRILQEAGLVEVLPNRGVIVRRVQLQDVLHEYDIRGALWRLGGREAARNLSHRQMDELEVLIEKMDAVIGDDDIDAYIKLNTRFHDAIASATGNRPFIVLQRRLFLQSRLFRRQSLATESGLPERNDDHRLMLEAFRRGDAEAAGALSEEHVLRSKARFIANLEKAGALSVSYDSAP